ncbi:IclR family transcriptional regulator [Candidatus Formimonas warabiya]|uniref:IclR family transcriptional regulator n=1 Tax=Formimonas warabiya TaxID=1761012 RepID=UPI001BE44489|nr:IclR family transcriptional regulator [Candidatus Formimonas warabiya]
MNDVVLSIQKACSIIKCFNHETPELNLKKLCDLTGFPKSTVHRICTTLQKEGILNFDNDTNMYSLSLVMFELGTAAIKKIDIRDLIKKIMIDIVNETKETAALYVCHDFKRICIEKVESPFDVRQVVTLGKALPLYLGSSGKIILAWMSPSQRKEYFKMVEKELPKQLHKNIEEMIRELDRIKEQGYCQSFSERVPDSKSVSAPIFFANQIMVLTILGPAARIDDEKLAAITDILVRETNKINSLLKQ